jgi:hypothetical protein
VHHADFLPGDLDDPLARQRLAESGLVHVPVDAFDGGAERTELFAERGRREVAAVQDEIRRAEQSDACVGERSRSARQVRVGDDDDACQPASTTASTSLSAP